MNIIIKEFLEPWLGTLHLELISTIDNDSTCTFFYKILDSEEDHNKDKIGEYLLVDKQKGRTYGFENTILLNKNIINYISNLDKNDKIYTIFGCIE